MSVKISLIIPMVTGLGVFACRGSKPAALNDIPNEHGSKSPNKSLNLINGAIDTDNIYKDSVFLTRKSKDDDPKYNHGTAWVALRQRRCLVTSAHGYADWLDNQAATFEAVSRDQSVTPYIDTKQTVANGTSRWMEDGDETAKNRYTDIAIIWLADKKNPPNGGSKKYIDTYAPLNLSTSAPVAMPKNLTVVGYGPDPQRDNSFTNFHRTYATMSFDSYVNPYTEVGSNWWWSPSSVPKGSLYFTVDSDMAETVKGDSGGPALTDSTVWAAVQGYRLTDFTFAGVEKYAETGSLKNNHDWLKKFADFICTKRLTVYPEDGVASIQGTAARPVVHQDLRVNGKINLKLIAPLADDSVEYIHENMSIALSATLLPGYAFKQWVGPVTTATDGTVQKFCPCHGSTNPTCLITFDNIGNYTADYSSDDAICSAVTTAPGGGSSGGGPTAGTGGTDGLGGGSTTGGGSTPGMEP